MAALGSLARRFPAGHRDPRRRRGLADRAGDGARLERPGSPLLVYVLLLAVATRFIHFSLFDGSFFLPPSTFGTALYYRPIDFVVLMGLAALGRQMTRARQMSRQYHFLYDRAGPLALARAHGELANFGEPFLSAANRASKYRPDRAFRHRSKVLFPLMTRHTGAL